MTAEPGICIELELLHAPDGQPAARMRRTDVPTDFGTVWLTELPVLLEALLVVDDERDEPSTLTDPDPDASAGEGL